MPQYQSHALADLFPLIEGAEFDELVSSIKAHGLREPITLYNNLILDGRNRYRACEASGVEPRFEQFTGDDPYAFVADKNLHRRNLTPSQRGLIGARMATMTIGNPNLGHKSPNVGMPIIGVSQEQAAKVLGISKDTVLAAKLILSEGTPEEIQSVEKGERGVRTLSREIRERNPRDRSRTGQSQPNTARVQNDLKARQVNARLWQELRGALLSIGNLPQATDMAQIARNVSRGDIVDENLAHAISWLTEFQTAWNAKKKDAA